MAATGEISSFATSSYETALCVIPPESDCRHVDSLRALYDKNYGKWPPHINLIYPFVAPESLPQVKAQIETILHETPSTPPKHPITLDHAGYFEHRSNSTIFLSGESYDSISILLELRAKILRGLGQDATSNKLHLTIGQSKHETESSAKFLLNKAALLPSLVFAPCTLAILLRERISGSSEAASRMRIWGSIEVFKSTRSSPPLREFWLQDPKDHVNARQVQPGMTYQFDARRKQWRLADSSPKDRASPASLSISSYNLLTDSRFPTTGNRSPELIKVILSQAALADVLVLQEVSDDFLSYLLCNYEIQEQYPFASHGPPSQANIDPLPSLRNVVMLSKWHFDWRFVPFHRPHKGAVVATIPRTIQNGVRQGLPFVVGGVHLKSGLTDGSVAAKKLQLQHLTDHLNREYPAHPWIVAGDFNITTSKYTINEAEKSKSISRQTVRTLESMESTLSGTGFLDAWAVARVEGTASSAKSEAEDLFEGEEGATFNPRENSLAAATSGTWNGRPQRYDRILVRPCGLLSVSRFVEFGLPKTYEDIEQVASDHSGIRASFNVTDTSSESLENSETLFKHPVGYKHALVELSRDGMVAQVLGQRSIFPTTDEEKRRKDAFMLIRKVVLGLSDDGDATPDIPMIMVPVGSYALGVWTIDSDIDCLCIGSISSKVFFQLTRQRIHKAEAQGVRLLRRVDAKTGSMLELSVDGFNVDLQYCPAASVVERWSEFSELPPSDPIFNLSILSLRKLKPIRDLAYIRRTLPSIASFRIAYHFIKLWAIERGIYSGRFGLLSGTHITLMLIWICKRLAHDSGSAPAHDIIVSFFHHYAEFEWQNDMVYDAFFHKKKPRYHRSVREPMVLLGYHTPNSNIALAATVPGLKVLVNEFKRARERLSAPEMTWNAFFESTPETILTTGSEQFLSAHENYVKIDMQYWGRALSKGKSLTGWVESRCINLVVDIHKALPSLSVRVWPARFADKDTNETDTYYHGCYLIGLSRNVEAEIPESKEERAHAKQAIQKTFDHFLTQVQTDAKYYDPESSWVGVSLAKPHDLKDLTLDNREWGDYITDNESDSDDEDETPDNADEAAPQPSHKLPHRPSAPSTSIPVSATKLRPASDILNRLRWDSNLDPGDYIVGYEDRFLGAKETSLGRWKTEQTDEEFIPQHRILYFKKRGEGVGGGKSVWEWGW